MRVLRRAGRQQEALQDPEEQQRRKKFVREAEQLERDALDRLVAIPGAQLYVRSERVRQDIGYLLIQEGRRMPTQEGRRMPTQEGRRMPTRASGRRSTSAEI
jgi:hypothetical protein